MKQVLIHIPWKYTFYEEAGQFILDAICGGVALFEIKHVLSEDQVIKYKGRGAEYIQTLYEEVQSDPKKFMK